jgi:hypothetical protein
MHRLAVLAVLLCALLVPASVTTAARPDHAGKPARRHFTVRLTGAQEVPPVDATTAKGVAGFHLSKDGTTLRWRLVLTGITDITAAHIHGPAAADATAGVLVTLVDQAYPGAQQGLVLRGTIPRTAANFETTIAAMRAGQAYVNVHTAAHPGGEIRGQFRAKGGAEKEDEAKQPDKPKKPKGPKGNNGKGRGQD